METRQQIRTRVAREKGVSVVYIAQSGIEHGFGVDVILSVESGAASGLKKDIATIVAQTMGKHVPVTVLLLRSAGTDEPLPPSP